MTKRLSIALIAAALFVVLAVLPVSASTVNPNNFNGTVIDAGATVFIGEQGLNLTRAMNQADFGYSIGNDQRWLYQAPTNTTIAWWASGSTSTNPDYSVNIQNRYTNFLVDQDTFVGRTGNWFLTSTNGNTVTKMGVVMNVQDPQVTVAVWDWSQNGKDVTGLNVVRGEHLAVKVNTNMYAATYNSRNNTVWERASYPANGAGISLPSGGMIPAAAAGSNRNITGVLPTVLVAGTTYADVKNSTVFIPVQGTTVYQVVNYSSVAKMTYGGAVDPYFGGNAFCNLTTAYYWNTTSPATDLSGTSATTSGYNYSTSVYGLSPGGQNQTAITSTCYGTSAAGTYDPVRTPSRVTDGYMTLKVKDESGAVLTKLWVGDTSATTPNTPALTAITYQFVNNQPWYLGSQNYVAGDPYSPGWWVTDQLVNGQYAYATGTYQIWAESMLNNMKDNYRSGGADYTGHTLSAVGTVTLISDTVKIEANKDSVVRSKAFSVTVTGKAQTQYYIWVKDTSTMTGGYDDQAPYITQGQDKVYFDCNNGDATVACVNAYANPTDAAHPIGNYQYDNGNQNTIWQNVAGNTTAAASVFKARYYALINTTTTGTRSVGFTTTNWTKAQTYTIRVEQNMPPTASGYGQAYGQGTIKSDEVDIRVEKGAVTIVAAGDGTYYLGDEIKLSGTNTETTTTYLFLIGPNLPTNGAVITNSDPRHAGSLNPGVANGVPGDFKQVDVQGDNTWSWKWGTAGYALDGGPYTIYAVSQPSDKQPDHLAKCAYNTVSITIKKPFVSATASQSTVAKGDKLYITGTAQGNPDSVRIWIMGKNKAAVSDESVNSDGSFSYEIKKEDTKDWASGQYFVVVQHPMQNKQYDVYLDTSVTDYTQATYGWVVNRLLIAQQGGAMGTGSRIFKLLGANSLQGSDAAKALADGIDNANVDDTYTKLQFLVEEPKITIDTIGDKHVGDKFTITATTNLAVDDEVLVQVYSSSFKPTQKSQSGEYSGATGTRKVTKGDSGMNKISFDVDSSTFKPDEYIVTEDAVLQSATANALFNVLEPGTKPVATTAVVTTAPVQTTAQQTVVQTTVATPVPTTTKPSPGFGALIALIGLGAVAFVVVRRH